MGVITYTWAPLGAIGRALGIVVVDAAGATDVSSLAAVGGGFL